MSYQPGTARVDVRAGGGPWASNAAEAARVSMVPRATTSRAISDRADEHLIAIDVLVRGLLADTVKYRHRPLDWQDVASLGQVREQLGGAVKSFSSAEADARLHRAARQVATEVSQFRQIEEPIR
jgi:hypothetical protein